MESERIKNQYEDSKDLYEYLLEKKEISFASYIDDVYKNVLVLSAASYFESKISELISGYAEKACGTDKRIVHLVKSKAVERQYHTLFDWDSGNTNKFWKFFGEETKNDVRIKIKNDEQLQEAEKSFLELGQQRNLLVHKNFAETDVNTTVEEIYNKYCKACIFISLIETVLDPNYLKK